MSVVIPHGGMRAHLALVLAALAAQRYPASRLQVVVVACPAAEDPGRPLPAPEGLAHLEWRRFRRPGFAPAGARNVGIRAAEGDLIVSLDDDMVAPPGLVAAHAARHAAGPVATFGLRRFIRAPGDLLPGPDVHARLAALPDLEGSASNRPGAVRDWRTADAPVVAAHPHPYHLFHGCNLSYGRDLARAVGGWCEQFDGAWGYEDVEFGARLHAAGAVITWVPEALALHLEGPAGGAAPPRLRRGRNLRLVTARVPGYGEFRHRASGGHAADDQDPVAREAALRE
ncbi:MAG TPA: glycosyltransferase [Miltoncostaeaceae bacterium]|nr:glycosyltransferase [Miltoncostaeaceae bacterium]